MDEEKATREVIRMLLWANGDQMTDKEEEAVHLLRKAGCKCEIPLLGEIPGKGPRCRMCGVEITAVTFNRSPQMQIFIDHTANRLFGRTLTESLQLRACTTCGKPVINFKDVLSRKEYAISGMCQECQDKTFG